MQANNQTARGQIREKERSVFWVHCSGDVMIAPDSQLQPLPFWTRVECTTAKETEFYSRRLALQEFNNFRSLKIQDHLRWKSKRDQTRASCLLRKAKGYISPADEFANQLILQREDQRDEMLYKLVTMTPDLSGASLEIEKYDNETIKSRSNGKRRGLSDEEVNPMNEMLEGIR